MAYLVKPILWYIFKLDNTHFFLFVLLGIISPFHLRKICYMFLETLYASYVVHNSVASLCHDIRLSLQHVSAVVPPTLVSGTK